MSDLFPNTACRYQFFNEFSLFLVKSVLCKKLDQNQRFFTLEEESKGTPVLLVCLEGRILVRSQKDSLRLSSNEGIIFVLQKPVSIHHLEQEDFSRLLLIDFNERSAIFFEELIAQKGVEFNLGHALRQTLQEFCQHAKRSTLDSVFTNAEQTHALMMGLAGQLFKETISTPDLMETARKFMEANFHQNGLSLDEIAMECSISKFTLCKEFKNRFGITPGRYLQELRLQEAARLLLAEENLTISEIARRTGYDNSSYFGKVFKKVYGKTADQYRRSHMPAKLAAI